MLSRNLFPLATLLCLCNAKAFFSPPRALVPRDDLPGCQSVTLGLDASCWNSVPPNLGMESWLSRWNTTTTTCNPDERWANCFMRLANVTTNTTQPIRCDLIGPDVCPQPDVGVFEAASAEVSYGIASIWGKHRQPAPPCERHLQLTRFIALQQYMTSLYQFVTSEDSNETVNTEFQAQPAPRNTKKILINILNEIGDPLAGNLTIILRSTLDIGQKSYVIPTQAQAQTIIGQTVGYLLQWLMTNWIDGGYTGIAVMGNLIDILEY